MTEESIAGAEPLSSFLQRIKDVIKRSAKLSDKFDGEIFRVTGSLVSYPQVLERGHECMQRERATISIRLCMYGPADLLRFCDRQNVSIPELV